MKTKTIIVIILSCIIFIYLGITISLFTKNNPNNNSKLLNSVFSKPDTCKYLNDTLLKIKIYSEESLKPKLSESEIYHDSKKGRAISVDGWAYSGNNIPQYDFIRSPYLLSMPEQTININLIDGDEININIVMVIPEKTFILNNNH